ncbi:MAG TPA: phage Gp37/Gp68 family protein, partial [Terriglobales bacterium]
MSTRTAIEWTDSTWNPVRGCSRVSEGCRHCYAERVAARFSGPGQPYDGLAKLTPSGPRWTGKVELVEKHLLDPLRWKRPRRVFVNSMSDLFHEGLRDWSIAHIFAVAVASVHLRGHVHQILTKRSARMATLLNSELFWESVNDEAGAIVMERVDPHNRRSDDARATLKEYGPKTAPPGIWLGVSVEDQAAAVERIWPLLETPAAVRFISAEPLLGPVDLERLELLAPDGNRPGAWLNALTGHVAGPDDMGPKLDWVIVGGESGHGARPMHPDWARSLRDQCWAADVP